MRVLHVIPAVAARYGGPGVVAIESVRALRDAGVDALLVTTDADGDRRLAVDIGHRVMWEGVPAIFLPMEGEDRYKWSGSLARWLDDHVADFDVVDVHAVFSHSSVAAGRACRRRGVPYVVRPHGALDPWSLSRKAWQKRLLLWWGARPLLTGAAFMQYTTAAERTCAEQALAWLPPGRLVPLGVDPACFVQPATDTASPFLLTLSRLEEKKNLDLLIDAFHEVAVERGQWRLVIAGDGRPEYVDALRRRAKDGRAGNRITFAGWVSGGEKLRLLAGASALISPSAQENFGLSLVEAMAASVPVVSTTGVNLSADIESSGAGWVIDHTYEALVAVLRDVMGADAGRHTRGEAATRLAAGFTWARSAERLMALYAEATVGHEVARRA